MTIHRRFIVAVSAAALLFGVQSTTALSQEYEKKITATPLVKTEHSIVGEKLVYPGGGTAKITAATVTIPPGMDTGWHKHGVPLFAYMIKGEITVDYGDKGKKVYKPGDSFMEAMDQWHNGKNTGSIPADILAVYMGSPDATLVIKKDK